MLTHARTYSNSVTLWEKAGDKDTPAVLILSIHTQGCKDTSNAATLWAALACVLVWNRILFTCRAIKEQHARLALNTKLLDKAKCLQYSKMPVLMGQNKERRVILLQHGCWYFKNEQQSQDVLSKKWIQWPIKELTRLCGTVLCLKMEMYFLPQEESTN